MVRFSNDEEQTIMNTLENYLKHDKVRSMKKYISHGNVSTFDHSLSVVRLSYRINKKFSLKADNESLLVGALLHDFYLYDWHNIDDGSHRLHGYKHSRFAAYNAKKHFDVPEKVVKIIECHMWPLTITKMPKSREAAIVCFADKCCSLKETLFCR